MPAAARSKLCSSVSAWLGVFASGKSDRQMDEGMHPPYVVLISN